MIPSWGTGWGVRMLNRLVAEHYEDMTETLFYHLERRTLEDVLPGLIEKTLERGWRAVIRTESSERSDAIDTLLWTYDDQTFLPHAQSGDGDPKRQPVLITVEDDNPERRQVLFLVGGAAPPALGRRRRRSSPASC